MLLKPHSLLDHAVTAGIAVPQVIQRVGIPRALVALLKILFVFCKST